MDHIYTQKIDEVIKSNKVYRFNKELLDTKDVYRIKQINHILQEIQEYVSHTEIQEIKMKKHINVLRESCYNKRWQDLKEEQKLNRLDKYITDNNIILEQKDIIRLKEYLTEKKLLPKHIKYDRYKGLIKDITVITKTDNVYELTDLTKKNRVVRKKQ